MSSLDELVFVLSSAAAITVIRAFVSGAQRRIFQKIPNIFGAIGKKVAKPGKTTKFSENLWYGSWHLLSFIMILSTISNDTWFRSLLSGNLYSTFGASTFVPTTSHKTIYLFELSFWISCLIYLAFEGYRSDTPVLLVHHVATIALIYFSYISNYIQIGVTVMLIHDISDVALYWAKVLSYTYISTKITDVIFQVFAISFFITRLIVYPIVCVFPGFHMSYKGFRDNKIEVAFSSCVALLGLLQILHIYWFSLIVKIALMQANNEAAGDIRSDESELESNENSKLSSKIKFESTDVEVKKIR